MAQREGVPALRVEDVRTAVLHLVELAAAFEGRGHETALKRGQRDDVLEHSGFEPTTEDETFEDDARCLAAAVKLLLAHRRRQRLLQRNAFLEGLTFVLSELYRAYVKDEKATAHDLQLQIEQLCSTYGIRPSDSDLDALVLDRGGGDDGDVDGEACSIRAMGGPVESAKKVVSKLVGLSEGTMAEIRRWPHPLATARRPFGRWVPRQARRAYADDVHDGVGRATAKRSLVFRDLRELQELNGALLDRVMENLLRRTTLDAALRDAVLVPSYRTRLREIEGSDLLALRAHAWSYIEAGKEGDVLPDSVRSAADAVARAIANNTPDREQAIAALETTMLASVRASLEQGLNDAARDTFGSELDDLG